VNGAARRGLLRWTAYVSILASAIVATTACEVGVGYSNGYDSDYPPDAYIGTTEPIYFEGRANYWYGGHWYYRNGGGWNHYDREPPALYQRRSQAAPVRRNFEPSRGRPAAAPARTGGWRGGRR
jgi:hypothetical protein